MPSASKGMGPAPSPTTRRIRKLPASARLPPSGLARQPARRSGSNKGPRSAVSRPSGSSLNRCRGGSAPGSGGRSHPAPSGAQVPGFGRRCAEPLELAMWSQVWFRRDDAGHRASYPRADHPTNAAALPRRLTVHPACAVGAAPSWVARGARLTAASRFHTLVSADTAVSSGRSSGSRDEPGVRAAAVSNGSSS